MSSKNHVCERRGWSASVTSERKERQRREKARHILRSQLLASHLSEGGLPVFEFARFRRRFGKELKAWRKRAAADAMRAIPEPESLPPCAA